MPYGSISPVEDEASFAKINEFDSIVMATQACDDDWFHKLQGNSGSTKKRHSTSLESNEREDEMSNGITPPTSNSGSIKVTTGESMTLKVPGMQAPDWNPIFDEWDKNTEDSDPSTCPSTPTSLSRDSSPNCTDPASSPTLDSEFKPIGSDWFSGESPSHVSNFPGEIKTIASF
jgi:hypothetical protein